jgi:hypothetical protein
MTINHQPHYIGDCTQLSGMKIQNMNDNRVDITRKTFLQYVPHSILKEYEKSLGYDNSLKMCNDWYISYHKSKYNGKKCVFFKHSAIEYVFLIK